MPRRFALLMLLALASCGSSSPAPEPGTPAQPSSSEPDVARAEPPAAPAPQPEPGDLQARADAIAKEILILDSHIELSDRSFDDVRSKAGGLDASFMSIDIPPKLADQFGASRRHADREIDRVEQFVAAHPDRFALARSPAELRANFARGLISLPLGLADGDPIEEDLVNLQHFHHRGIRSIALVHTRNNQIADSSHSNRHTHGGLTVFGREVVTAMNRMGIMIDVAHLTEPAFNDVLEVSKVPVIASHSSCRHLTPGSERNASDPMIRALAAKGGVIRIAFDSALISSEYRLARERGEQAVAKLSKAKAKAYWAENPLPEVRAEHVADHIDHVVKLVGIEHVGLSSGFGGADSRLPVDLRDVSMYPNLFRVLLERGYSKAEIELIAAGNMLRVWQTVEDHGRASMGPPVEPKLLEVTPVHTEARKGLWHEHVTLNMDAAPSSFVYFATGILAGTHPNFYSDDWADSLVRVEFEEPPGALSGEWPLGAWALERRTSEGGNEQIRLHRLKGAAQWVPEEFAGTQWHDRDSLEVLRESWRSGYLVVGSFGMTRVYANGAPDLHASAHGWLRDADAKLTDLVESRSGHFHALFELRDSYYVQGPCAKPTCVESSSKRLPNGRWTWTHSIPRGQQQVSILVAGGTQGDILHFGDGRWLLEELPDGATAIALWPAGHSGVWIQVDFGPDHPHRHGLLHRAGEGEWSNVALPEGVQVSHDVFAAVDLATHKLWLIGEREGAQVIFTTNASTYVAPAPAEAEDEESGDEESGDEESGDEEPSE
jgi:membrane dipeptidase